MKCPKCGINLLDHIDVCPFCKTPIPKNTENVEATTEEKEPVRQTAPVGGNTGRYAAIDPDKDSYDFDLQYTLTFRDSGEIKQAIADMDAEISRDSSKKKIETHRETSEPRYSLEEMQAAALRAQERRERRKNAAEGGKRKRPSHAEKRRSDALRAAKAPKRDRGTHISKDASVKSKKGLFIGIGVLAAVVAVIVGVVNVVSYFAHKTPEYPTLYTKGNELYSYYDGDEIKLSGNFVTAQLENSSDAKKDESGKTSSSSKSSNTKKLVDPKVPESKKLSEKDFIKISDDGSVVYFLENVNMNTGSGDLVYYLNGKEKSRTVVTQNVYCDFTISADGSTVFYLKNTDGSGGHGELCRWTASDKAEMSIDTDITSGNFKPSVDSMSITYIKNFNPTVHTGDLLYTGFGEGAEKQKRVDEKVAFVFGTTAKSNVYFYAKDYDTKKGTYNLYIQSTTEGPKSVAENAFLAPVISKKSDSAYIYSNYSNNFQTLSYLDLTNGSNNKLSDEVSEIVRVRNDEGAVVFSRAYETDKADYYFVSAKSPNVQKVATAINLAAAAEDARMVPFDASADFSTIAYVGGYDTEKKKGALYTLSVINDYASSEKRISDDAYTCNVSSDGAVVRFASGYNAEQNTVNIVSYSNSNTLSLADGAGMGAFTFDKSGEYTIFAKDFAEDPNTNRKSASIKSVTSKAKVKDIDNAAAAYGLKSDGTILLKKEDTETGNMCLYTSTVKGGKPDKIADGITNVLFY